MMLGPETGERKRVTERLSALRCSIGLPSVQFQTLDHSVEGSERFGSLFPQTQGRLIVSKCLLGSRIE